MFHGSGISDGYRNETRFARYHRVTTATRTKIKKFKLRKIEGKNMANRECGRVKRSRPRVSHVFCVIILLSLLSTGTPPNNCVKIGTYIFRPTSAVTLHAPAVELQYLFAFIPYAR